MLKEMGSNLPILSKGWAENANMNRPVDQHERVPSYFKKQDNDNEKKQKGREQESAEKKYNKVNEQMRRNTYSQCELDKHFYNQQNSYPK